MDHLEALILGIVQGVTEFLPVSSSAHLALVKRLFGIAPSEEMVSFDLLCHLGTLCALMQLLWKDAFKVLKNPRAMALFTLALLPLIPAYLLLKPLRAALAAQTGWFLLCTSTFLFLSSRTSLQGSPLLCPVEKRKGQRVEIEQDTNWRDVLCIGIAQSMALLPGISRSGSTISTARWLGWEWKDAARFSFLLAIPTILGGSLLETARGSFATSSLSWSICLTGFLASFLVGLASLRLLFWMLERGTLRPFAWYCLVIGIFALFVL